MTGFEDNHDPIEARLHAERPQADPAFELRLRERLLGMERSGSSRPDYAGALIASYAACGSLLLAVALLGALGSGPLAA